MIQMRNINKRFDAVVALKDANLNINDGEIMALLGSNGSGKSTLIKILAGIYGANSGDIIIDGKPVTISSGFDSKNLGIATAFQEMSLIPTMSVIDNMLLGKEPTKALGMVDHSEAKKEVQALLDRFKIECDLDDYVNTLMPSTQYLLELAKAIASKPKILLLDEVTAALHADEVETAFGILRELKSQGVAMVYVTHRMKEIYEICDRATIMRNGETIIEAPVSELDINDVVYYMTGAKIDETTTVASGDYDVSGRELMLEAENIKLMPRIKDISLKVYKGEIVGIGGLEGQGQSEFVRAILGSYKFESGKVVYDGKEISYNNPSEAVNSDIGFVSGERAKEAIFKDRTIAENVFAGKAVRGALFKFLTTKTVNQFTEEAVDKYKIRIGTIQHPASSLSGGNQQKLAVARWIASQPKLLLLDDPTKGIDVHSRKEIHDILKQCAQEGMTIIVNSSDTDELINLSDRVYVFYDGRVSGEFAGSAKTNENISAAMMGLTIGKEEE
ncbi:MAG: sugar ABC transporter ATP-binding protein [Lachnospiraceae bacterium]|nr:sugar ABC transporter ATP-binding protein [Candidatus Minthocola equi]